MTTNEVLLDAMLRHQVYLLRRRAGLVQATKDLQLASTKALKNFVRKQMAGYSMSPSGIRRATATANSASKQRRKELWAVFSKFLLDELKKLSSDEIRHMRRITEGVAIVDLGLNDPPGDEISSLPTSVFVQGRSVKQWIDRFIQQDQERIQSLIIAGLNQGEDSARIANSVALASSLSLNHAATLTATAFVAVADGARGLFSASNSEVIGRELYVATLDHRTTPICFSLDGDVFRVGEGPHPPLHFWCRSIRVYLFTDTAIGLRPVRPFTERQFLREFADRRGIQAVSSRSSLPHGTKLAFDRYSAQRARELTGRVPAKLTYAEFFSRQPASFQDDVLGPTRGRLYRRGKLPLKRFVENDMLVPLSKLAQREAAAFKAAGFDLGDF